MLASPAMAQATIEDRIDRLELGFNRHGIDPFGVSKKQLARYLGFLSFFYKTYFHVKVDGIQHVPARGRVMLVGNHSGGIAVDASMVIASLFLEMDPPRLAHAMADKFLGKLPFIADWLTKSGQFLGLPETAEKILDAERPLVVFPEGHHGTAKLYPERHTLVEFGTGFVRMALAKKAPIVPFAFLGAGDAIPTIKNLEGLGKLFGVPYIPVTPYLLPVPKPVPLHIYYGAPMAFTGRGDEEDLIIQRHVQRVKDEIQKLIERGEKERATGVAS